MEKIPTNGVREHMEKIPTNGVREHTELIVEESIDEKIESVRKALEKRGILNPTIEEILKRTRSMIESKK